jgi:branched-subunit amino acid aminotransferase/4-amino-4-deoxychorismate lyase
VLGLEEWGQRLQALLTKNQAWLKPEGDASLVVVASPGHSGEDQPTFMMYLEPLPKGLLRRRYENGVPLVVSSVRNVPSSCWPTHIKTRSRLHYYMADCDAKLRNPDSIALLLDSFDQVADTSIACVLIGIGGNWSTPTLNQVLPSTTLLLLDAVCRQTLQLQRRAIHVEELKQATEVLLLGSTGLVHAASSIDLRNLGGSVRILEGPAGEGYQRLLQASFAELKIDFVTGQAAS